MLVRFLALWLTLDWTLARPAPRLSFPLFDDSQPCTIGGFDGISTDSGACRYTVRYAQTVERWGYSNIVSDIASEVSTELPPACPQSSNALLQTQTSEDCLYAVVYTPGSASAEKKLPVFVWVHGGSFVSGGASAPGLDGSSLAIKGAVVIVIQYRLGVLGFLPPAPAASASDPNLGVLDLVNGLKSIQIHAHLFGGDPAKVTIGGQSSGAGMIRSLLGIPQATGLFRAAILQSDPMSYGLASPDTTTLLRDAFYSSSRPLSSCKDMACLQNVSLTRLLDAQDDLLGYAPYTFEGVPLAEVIRPTHCTNTIPHDPTPLLFTNPHSLFVAPPSIPLLITTTKNEGGSVIQQLFPVAVPASNTTLSSTLNSLVGSERARTLRTTNSYTLSSDRDSMRETFDAIVTDGVWRCPNRAVASAWAGAGGNVWVGEWVEGNTYSSNKGDYCQANGRVCHEVSLVMSSLDDIYLTFGTGSEAVSYDLAEEVAEYWLSFITDLDPNPGKFKRDCEKGPHGSQVRPRTPQWHKYSGTEIFPLGSGEVAQCQAIWHGGVQYDWQLFP